MTGYRSSSISSFYLCWCLPGCSTNKGAPALLQSQPLWNPRSPCVCHLPCSLFLNCYQAYPLSWHWLCFASWTFLLSPWDEEWVLTHEPGIDLHLRVQLSKQPQRRKRGLVLSPGWMMEKTHGQIKTSCFAAHSRLIQFPFGDSSVKVM